MMIEIDGAQQSGSGTIVRYAVALSALLGQPLRLFNARAKREKPGLRPQHLSAVLACAELCGKSHFGMEREVVVVSQSEYDQWLNKQTPMYQPPVAETPATDSSKAEIKKPQAMLTKN